VKRHRERARQSVREIAQARTEDERDLGRAFARGGQKIGKGGMHSSSRMTNVGAPL